MTCLVIIQYIEQQLLLNKSNQKSTIIQFVKVYSGPEYMIFLKYAYIMKYVAISLVYGYALPILFPITGVALIN